MTADFLGRDVSALRERFADLSAVAGVRRVVLSDGRARGLEVAEVRNGLGFRFDVLLGRGLDIGFAEFGGVPISWRSPVGDVAAEHFDPHGKGWLRSFHGGLLVGCGLRQVGAASTDGAEALGVHGRLSNTPAESVSMGVEWDRKVPQIEIRGRIREASVLGENLRLDRMMSCPIWENRIDVTDVITNDACDPSPLMYLLHINLGFPIVSESTELVAPILETTARDAAAARHLDQAQGFGPPDAAREEEVFFHRMAARTAGQVTVALVREQPVPLGVAIEYDARSFSQFASWKVTRPGTYAAALEPANCLVLGMQAERAAGRLETLQPGASRTFTVSIEVLTTQAAIDRVRGDALSSFPASVDGTPTAGG